MQSFTKGLGLLVLSLFIVFAAQGQTFYCTASGTTGQNFNAGNAWNTGTASCACGGSTALSWPTTSGQTVSICTPSKTITCASASQTCGNLTITSGTLVISPGCTLNAASVTLNGGTLTVNGTLNITNGNFTISSGTFNGTSGTVAFLGGAQNIPAASFGSLTCSGSGLKTMQGNVSVSGTLSLIGSGNALVVGNNTLTATGTITQTSSGIITLSSASPYSSLVFGSTAVSALGAIVSNASGYNLNALTVGSGSVNLGAKSAIVNGLLTMGGDLTVGANTLTLNGTVTGFSNSNTLIGSATSNLSIGGTGAMGSINFSQTNTTEQTFASITVNRSSGTLTFATAHRITTNGTYNLLAGTVTNTGTLSLSNGTIFTRLAPGTISAAPVMVSGTYSMVYGNGVSTTAITTGNELLTTTTELNNMTVNVSGGVTLNTSVSPTVNGTLTLTAGNLALASNTLTVITDFASAGTGNITGSASSNLTIRGTGTLSGALRFNTTTPGTTNNLNNYTQNRTSTGVVNLGTNLTISGTATLTAGTFNIPSTKTLDITGTSGTVALGGGTVALGGGTFQFTTNNNTPITRTSGSITSTSGNLYFVPASGSETWTVPASAFSGTIALTAYKAAMGAAGSVTLNNTTDITISSAFDLVSGLSILNTTGNMQLGSGVTYNGNGGTTASSTNMIVTSSTGLFKRTIGSNGVAYTFPIGDNTGTAEYSGFTLNFSSGAASQIVGFRVVDGNPNNSSGLSNFLSRYWVTSFSGTATYTYTMSLPYNGTSGDINGVESGMIGAYKSGTNWISGGTVDATNNLVVFSGATQSTAPLATGNEFTGIEVGCPSPTAPQSINVSSLSISASPVLISGTAEMGNGTTNVSGIIIFANISNVNAVPVDGVNYNVGDVLPSGAIVIFKGGTVGASIPWSYNSTAQAGTPLSPNTFYYLNFYSYAAAVTCNTTYSGTWGFSSLAPNITPTSIPSVQSCANATASVPYTSTGDPDQYNIVWDAPALSAGFVNVQPGATYTTGFTTLSAGSITVSIPAGVTPGTYSGKVNPRNSSTGFDNFTYNGAGAANLPSIQVSVTAGTAPPTGNATQNFCSNVSHTVNDLTATGTAIQWYAAATGGSPLSGAITLVNGNHYYASQTLSGCESAARFDVTVTVYAAPSLSIGGLSVSYCIGTGNVTLTGTPSGGTFSGTGISGTTFSPSTAGIGGPYTITYNYTDANLCSYSTNQNTTVFDLPAVSFSGLNASYSVNAGAATLTGSPSGGTFSGAGISGNTFTPASAGVGGPYTITYSYTDGNSCTNSSTGTVSVTSASSTSTYTWTGATNTSWATNTNWNPIAPAGGPNSCGVDVIIPSVSNQPVVSSPVAVGNLQLNNGAQLTLNANLSACKNLTGAFSLGSSSVIGSASLILNGSTPQTINGVIEIDRLRLNNSQGASLVSSAQLSIGTSLDLQTGNFNASVGQITFKSTSTTNAAIIDNFTSGYTGTFTGTIKAQRYFLASQSYNQHFMGTPVNATGFSQFGASGTAGYIIPTANCDETSISSGSPYSTVLELDETHGATCTSAQWIARAASSGNMVNGKGYAVAKAGSGTFTVSGTPNLSSTYTVSGLTNSNWSNTTLQAHTVTSGWHLIANPYLASWAPGSLLASGFDNQVQVWNANGPFAGSYQAYTAGSSAVIPPFGAVMVHKTTVGGSATFTINATDRVRTAATFYQANDNELTIVAKNNNTNLLDQTLVAFNTSATNQFDPAVDADKSPGALNRHTLYTINNGKWMAKNILHDMQQTSTVAVGFEPGNSATYTFSFNGVNTFDATSYIYLEDKALGIMHNVRNGDYNFSADSSDNWNRFVLHFTPAAQFSTTDASCNTTGNIQVVQPGDANWNYTLTDANNTTISTGTVNRNNPINIAAQTGNYTLTLVDHNNYTVTQTINVGGTEPIAANFNTSATTVREMQNVVLTATTANATSYQWNLGNGQTATGQVVNYEYPAAGTYTVVLTVTNLSGCTSSTSRSVTVTDVTTGLGSIVDNKAIGIWSNENTVFVDFRTMSKVDAVITIYNVLGQEISNEKFNTNSLYKKEIENVEASYMIVTVKMDDKVTTKKVLINNYK